VRIPLQQEIIAEQSNQLELLPEPIIEEDVVSEELSQDPEFRKLFWEETQKHLSVLQAAFDGSRLITNDGGLLDKTRQASHTLKGNVGAMQMNTLYEIVSQLDGVLQQASKGTLTLTQTHLELLNHLLDNIISVAESEQNT
jgi:chemotaxis protein histidine kinase CheA